MAMQPRKVLVRRLTPQDFSLFGWVLGKPPAGAEIAFENATTDFRSEHQFYSGVGGGTEILWVRYRDSTSAVSKLEVHHLTEQAIIPLDGDVIQVVALSNSQGAPDMATLAAFAVSNGTGVCMRPACMEAR
ncbi:ureidoglycolate lyase [Acetobacter malorum]|uniref:ureidoglycolate lyase n=1 Tax=Acetobacter malorum TaxID=178901 RepID=UPI0039EBB38B